MGVIIMKQLCVYGETEKIRKYIVGEGIHKYALGKERKNSVMYKCVIYVSVCIFSPQLCPLKSLEPILHSSNEPT